jgi:hypothetical protein
VVVVVVVVVLAAAAIFPRYGFYVSCVLEGTQRYQDYQLTEN